MARGRDAVTKPAVSNTSGARRDSVSPAIANSDGVEHLHISGDQPEAEELRSFVEGMRGVNVDHARRSPAIFNPAVSPKQRQLMAIAEHEPSKVYKRNRGVTKMSKSQLHDYASTKGL
jgi:hypothetical protein